MRRLTESLLELARLDEGSEKISRGEVDLAEIVRASMERLRPLAERTGIRIHGELAPARTVGNAGRLDQLMANLLANAIHYNKPEGEVRVATFTEAGAAVLQVSDTGVGIPAADLPRIFDRFYRVEKARSRADGHTGLGLAICKAIVDAEGGNIEVASTVGLGTTFTVRLPVAKNPLSSG
jgi:signal transduction histidine kinase